MNRGADRVTIVGARRRHAHRRRQRLKVDRRIGDLHAHEPAGDGVGVAELPGDVLQHAIAAIVEHDEDDPRAVTGGAPQRLR